MKNFKKLISAVTAFAMTATMFAGLGISANAEETYNITSSESAYVSIGNPDTNYNGAEQESLVSLYTQFRDWSGSNATAIGTMNFRNGSASMPMWKFDISDIPAGANIAEADVTLTVTGTGDAKEANQMRIVGYNGEWEASTITYSNMENIGGRDITTYLTGTVDGLGSFQPLNTTDTLATSTDYPQTIAASLVDYLESAVAAGRDYISIAVAENSTRTVYFSTQATLNIVTTEEALYNVTMTTAPMATVTVNDATYYSDANGNVNLGAYTADTVLDYSVVKSGYTSLEEQSVTVGTDDMNIEAPLTIADENMLYYEDYTSAGVANRGEGLFGSQRYYNEVLQVWANGTAPIQGVTGGNMYTVSISDYNAYTQRPGDRDRTKTVAFTEGGTALFTLTAVMTDGGTPVTTLSTSTETVSVPASGNINLTIGEGRLVGTIGDAAISMSAAESVSAIDGISFTGNGDVYLTMEIGAITITSPDPDYLAISGPANIAKLAGVDRTAEYDYIVSYFDPTETFTWGVSGVDGVTIDQEGVLTVADTAAQGTATISLESSTGKSATHSVEIGDFAAVASYQIKTAKTLNTGEETTISVYDIIDENGADITEYVILENFVSDDDTVVAVDGSGNVTAVGNGTATVSFNIDTGKDNAASVDYKVDAYSMIIDAPSAGQVDVSGLVTYGTTEFKVVREDGTAVTKTSVDGQITLDAADVAGAVEIIPVYKFNLGSSSVAGYTNVTDVYVNGYGLASTAEEVTSSFDGLKADGYDLTTNSFIVDLPDGMYDFVFDKADTNRTRICVNGSIAANEADYNAGEANNDIPPIEPITVPGTYAAEDIVVSGGQAVVSASWDRAAAIGGVEIAKQSVFEERPVHVYIAGDSTVTNYNPIPTSDDWGPGVRRAGWGQLLDQYLGEGVIVDNYAHSGDYALNWYNATWPSVKANAKAGDYIIVQFGINDRNYTPDQAVMKAAVTAIVTEAKALGMIPVMQTPQICISQYGDSTGEHDKPNGSGNAGYFDVMRQVAEEQDTLLIDLADITGDLWATMGKTWVAQNYFLWNTDTNAQNDPQHMSYQGAKLVAGLVAADIARQQEATHGSFAGITVNEVTEQQITYVDVTDSQTKTVAVELPAFGDVPEAESGVRTTINDRDVSVEFVNESGKTAVVYVAEYDSNDILVNVTMDTFEISSDSQTETVSYAKENADSTIKAYVWTDMQAAFNNLAE